MRRGLRLRAARRALKPAPVTAIAPPTEGTQMLEPDLDRVARYLCRLRFAEGTGT